MMVCNHDHVEMLLKHQETINEEGVIRNEDDLPLSVLDISEQDIQTTKDYLTVTAYRDMYQLCRHYIDCVYSICNLYNTGSVLM